MTAKKPKDAYEAGLAELRSELDSTPRVPDLARVYRLVSEDIARETASRRFARTWRLSLAAACAILALVTGFDGLWPSGRDALPEVSGFELVASSGDVRFVDDENEILASRVDAPMRDVVAVLGEGARANVRLPKRAEMVFHGPARVELRSDGAPAIAHGNAEFNVSPHPLDRPFVVHAGQDRVIVRGTRFSLEVQDNGLARLVVTEGRVEVVSSKIREGHRIVAAGESYEKEPEAPTNVVETKGRHEEPEERDEGRAAQRESAPIARGERRLRDEPNDTELLTRAKTALEERRCEVVRASADALEERRVRSPAASRIAMMLAECFVRTERTREAILAYRSIASRFDADAETALFAAATLLDRAGESRESLSVIEEMMKRHPRGRIVVQARFRRCELFAKLGEAASECFRDFARRHPIDPRTDDALWILAEIAREGGHFAEAAELYRQVFARSTANNSERAEEAAYRRVECVARGRSSGLDEAIDDYEKRFSRGAHREEVRRWRAK